MANHNVTFDEWWEAYWDERRRSWYDYYEDHVFKQLAFAAWCAGAKTDRPFGDGKGQPMQQSTQPAKPLCANCGRGEERHTAGGGCNKYEAMW